MQSAGVSLGLIGFVATATNLLSIIPARGAHFVQQRLGGGRAMRIGWLSIAILVLVVGLSDFWGGVPGRIALIVGLVMTGIIYECVFPIVSDCINSMVPSAQRATVLSAGGMIFSICMISLFPLFGLVGDAAGLSWGYIAMGSLAIAAGVGVWIIRHRRAMPAACQDEMGETAGGDR